jgi:type II secretory pathway pseudopilin PulG
VRRHRDSGFTIIEALLVIAISIITAAIAIPIFTNAVNNYRLTAAVSATTGAISATRMQAIMHGCSYEVIFTTTSLSYQVYSEVPAIGTSGCLTAFALVTPNVGSATTPLPNAGPINMYGWVSCTVTSPPTLTGCTAMTGTTITYTFASNGTVTVSPAGAGMQLKNPVKSNTIWVSGVGDVQTSNP